MGLCATSVLLSVKPIEVPVYVVDEKHVPLKAVNTYFRTYAAPPSTTRQQCR
ncbi:hypothetical protein PC116_g16418 [Phytophthora cactorum]|nr:hypothetical protein C6341_g25199 [Phytophthora cactorum]KAG4235450.1 hypothetical protein PC116_g16418 [Phytophthora cactorum]